MSLGVPAGRSATAFVNVNVVPMDHEGVLASQTVVVEGERVIALGPAAQIQVPAGAVRVDGRGKYLMPGLTDMHTHYEFFSDSVPNYDHFIPLLFANLASGVTAIRSLNADPRELALAHTPAVEEKLTPHIYTGQRILQNLSVSLSPDSVIAGAKAAGVHFAYVDGKALRRYYDSTQLASFRRNLPLASHNHGEDPFILGAAGGSIEHLYWSAKLLGLDSLQIARFFSKDSLQHKELQVPPSVIQGAAAALHRAGTWVAPSLGCYQYKTDWENVVKKIWRPLVRAMQDSGVGLLLSAEGGYLYDDLAAMVQAGLSPYQALRTGTYNVAQYFNTLDERGTVAVGKRADLVLLAGNPLTNIRYAQEPAGVMNAGRWFDRAELDQRLLAMPRAWFRSVIQSNYWPEVHSGVLSKGPPEAETIKGYVQQFEVLRDSLAAAPSPSIAEPLRRRATELLGAMREVLPPLRRVNFDPMARVWIREQARQGHSVVVAGVTPAP